MCTSTARHSTATVQFASDLLQVKPHSRLPRCYCVGTFRGSCDPRERHLGGVRSMSHHVCKGKSTQTCDKEVAPCDSQRREADAQEWQMCKGNLPTYKPHWQCSLQHQAQVFCMQLLLWKFAKPLQSAPCRD